jgi:UDP-N-acetylmuramate dehydrogenase
LLFAEKRGLPVFVLGGGSNLLVADKGFDGLMIKIALRGLETSQDKADIYVSASAGEDWDEFVEFCVDRDLAGVECLSGIPGTVGATPVQNVGAYGQEVSETIVSVRVIDRQTKERKLLLNHECGFAYRTSIFNTTHKDKYIVLAVNYCLYLNGLPTLRYADLKNYFVGKSNPSLAEVRRAVLEIRGAKSMVISPADENRRSAGSFFKNPIISAEKYAKIQATARRLNLIDETQSVPSYPATAGNVKVPAAWLIEKSGFHKGYERGRAGLSTRHTLAVINRGGASAEEILSLVQEIQNRVNEQFGVQLQPEPVFIG